MQKHPLKVQHPFFFHYKFEVYFIQFNLKAINNCVMSKNPTIKI